MDQFAMQSFGQGNPMFAGQGEPNQVLDFNLDAVGGNPLFAMLGQAGVNSVFGSQGLMPSRLFPSQNFVDQYQAKDYWNQRQVAIAGGASADRQTYVNVMRGISRMTGRPFTPAMEQASQSLASAGAAISPIMTMIAPDFWDSMHGSRGSAAVMGASFHRAGRTAMDPVTGLTGLSGASAGASAASMLGARFSDPNADLTAFKGLSMGRLGMLHEELQSRGLTPGSSAYGGEGSQLDAIAGDRDFVRAQLAGVRARQPAFYDAMLKANNVPAGLSEGQQDNALTATNTRVKTLIDKIKKDVPEEYDTLKRDFDGKKIVSRLENLAGAVSAMKDVFGDAGRPNAPMREIVEGLNQLTQGGLATQSSATLERSVRMTQALAKSTGVGLDGAMSLMANGAGYTDQLGIERQFAVRATQGALAFGAAYGQSGVGATPHFQAKSREEMTVMDQRLRANAANSGLANQLNTALRIAGGLEDQGEVVGGSAGALVKAIREKRTTFVDPATGKEQSVFQDDAAFRRTMTAGGQVKPEDLMRYSMQRNTNRQYGAQYGTEDLVRQAQGDDVKGFYAQSQRASVVDLLRRHGVTGDKAEAMAMTASGAAASAVMGMNANDRRSDKTRNDVTSAAMLASLKSQGIDTRGISGRELHDASETGFGAFNESVARNPMLRGYGTAMAAIELQDKGINARGRGVQEEAAISGKLRSAMAGVGQTSLLARTVDMMQGPGDDLLRQIGKVLGGVDPGVVRGRLDAVHGMTAEQMATAGMGNDPAKVKAMTQDLERVTAEVEKAKAAGGPGAADLVNGAKSKIDDLVRGLNKATEASSDEAPGDMVRKAALKDGNVAKEADAADQKAVQRIVGTLKIEGDRGTLNARMDPGGAGGVPMMLQGT